MMNLKTTWMNKSIWPTKLMKYGGVLMGELKKLKLQLTRQEHLRNRRYRSFIVRTFADPALKEQEKKAIIQMDKGIAALRLKINKLQGNKNG